MNAGIRKGELFTNKPSYNSSVRSSFESMVEAGDFEKTIDVLTGFGQKSKYHLKAAQELTLYLLKLEIDDSDFRYMKGIHVVAEKGFLTRDLITKIIDTQLISVEALIQLLKTKTRSGKTPPSP